MSRKIPEDMFGNVVEAEMAAQLSEKVRVDKMHKYINAIINDLESYKYDNNTAKNFAKAIGNAEIAGSLSFGSSRRINSDTSIKK